METEFTITYEIIEPVTHASFITESRDEALDRYGRGYTVLETHITVTILSPFAQTQLKVISCWHDEDPEPEEA
jgi:hypothetical protein